MFNTASNLFRAADFGRAAAEANNIFDRFCSGSIPVDPLRIAGHLGIRVEFMDFRHNISEDILGLLRISEKAIYVNSNLPTNRATFTIAHEIGHFVMHREWAASNQYEALWRSPTWAPGSKPPEEQEADCFASNLLVPRQALKRFMQMEDDNVELARAFCVSEDVIFYAKQDMVYRQW